jgi:hypothetical protein
MKNAVFKQKTTMFSIEYRRNEANPTMFLFAGGSIQAET